MFHSTSSRPFNSAVGRKSQDTVGNFHGLEMGEVDGISSHLLPFDNLLQIASYLTHSSSQIMSHLPTVYSSLRN